MPNSKTQAQIEDMLMCSLQPSYPDIRSVLIEQAADGSWHMLSMLREKTGDLAERNAKLLLGRLLEVFKIKGECQQDVSPFGSSALGLSCDASGSGQESRLAS